MDELQFAERLVALLESSVAKAVKDEKRIAVAFSGGLDSSIIAHLARRMTDVTLYIVGTPESQDLKNARLAAEWLSLPLVEIVIGKRNVEDAIPRAAEAAGTRSPLQISFLLPMYFVAESCREEIVLSGQGADEEFAGYRKYLDVGEEALGSILKKDLEEVVSRGIERERKVASLFSKQLRTPYLDRAIVELAMSLPVNFKIRNGVRKHLLREAARQTGLPEQIVSREKKAAQYGSGIMKLMSAIARERKMDMETLCRVGDERSGACRLM